MTPVFEEPLYVLVAGGLMIVMLVAFWVFTGVRGYAYGALGMLLVTLVSLFIEQAVVTDYESVEDTILQIASDAELNDRTVLYKYISSTASHLKSRLDGDANRFQISRVAVDGVKVEMYPEASPPQAITTFKVYIRGKINNSSEQFDGRAVAAVKLTLLKEGGDWKVADYDYRFGPRGWNTGQGRRKKKRFETFKSTPPKGL